MLVKVANHQQKLSNLNKIFWPEEKIHKGDLIKYYLEIAEFLLPHLKNRPMVMKRYPDGIWGKSFYQKQCPTFAPAWIKKIIVENRQMIIVNNLDTLVWLINLGCIELHPWLSTMKNLTNPDIVVFDLDPEPPASFSDTLYIALLIKDILKVANLDCYPKTSGSEGLHIYVPIEPIFSFDIVRETLKNFCRYIVEKYPGIVTTELSKEKRKGKIYLDFLQNGYGKTMASVYSVRPLRGAPVSTPITWQEVSQGINKNTFNIFSLKSRLDQVGDLFAPLNYVVQDFSPLVNTLFFKNSRKN